MSNMAVTLRVTSSSLLPLLLIITTLLFTFGRRLKCCLQCELAIAVLLTCGNDVVHRAAWTSRIGTDNHGIGQFLALLNIVLRHIGKLKALIPLRLDVLRDARVIVISLLLGVDMAEDA